MGFLSRWFRRDEPSDDGLPFMEHPSGEHETAVDAMESAVSRLQSMGRLDRWLTFMAQGEGGGVDRYHFATLKLRGERIDPGEAALDADSALRAIGLDAAGVRVSRLPDGHFVLSKFSPRQVAAFMDALFRGQMGIRPHDGDGDDYAIGAEWHFSGGAT